MFKVRVTADFTLKDFHKLKNVVKLRGGKDNEFTIGDRFECDELMLKYLSGENPLNKNFVEVIESVEETKKEVKEENKENNNFKNQNYKKKKQN